MGEMSPEARGLLRFAGFLIWSLAGLPLFVRLFQVPELLHQPRYWLWLSCFFVFGIAFGLTPWRNAEGSRSRRLQFASLAAQAITALGMIVLGCSGHEGALLFLVSPQLGWVMPLRRGLLYVAVQAAFITPHLSP